MNLPYPPLPGADQSPSEVVKPPAGKAPTKAPASKPKTAAPPARVLGGGSLAGLSNAAFSPPAKPPGVVAPAANNGGPAANFKPTVPGVLEKITAAARVAAAGRAPASPTPDAVGITGGLPRWDDLRERLRRHHSIDPDDALYDLVDSLEQSELHVLAQQRLIDGRITMFLNRIEEVLETNGSARDHAEHASRLSADCLQMVGDLHEMVSLRLPPPGARPEHTPGASLPPTPTAVPASSPTAPVRPSWIARLFSF